MGKTATANRDWTQIYAIYGMDQWQTLVFLSLHAALFSLMSVLFLVYFDPICTRFEAFLSSPAGARFAAGFTGSVTAISAVCLFYAAGNFFYSAVPLHHEMAHRMVGAVGDWSMVRSALDLGCGRGILLNAVATQLKKTGSSGRVVGLAQGKTTALSTLRTAKMEGVQEYVTCREGDVRSLPFPDNYFDVVTSAVFVHTVGKEHGARTYVRRLQELRMEDIRVSERVTAFMVSSHIVTFRKPDQHVLGIGEVRLDWRC
ncbi:hypothetical protein CRG98_023331 [Punica granatum]|uniref:Methyltransferase type 11 domain-containing protein n=1 Tax=Punica granatum TaxID=22663 RepID=A0A2I0JJ76_PUNGR|nr:hypothetical protein CRG98_023331 [Punica granatum]